MTYLAAECHEEVSRKGELQPCDNQAVALKADPEGDYPVCSFHARGPMVPLLVGAAYVANQIADTIPPLAAKCGAPDYTGYAEGFGDALDFAEQAARGWSP
jgi:hypothetical protein